MNLILKLRTKLLIAFLAVGLAPFGIIGVVSMTKASNALTSQSYTRLRELREVKKEQIEKVFADYRIDLSILIETVSSLKQSAYERLNSILEYKRDQVEEYVAERLRHILSLHKSKEILDAVHKYGNAWRDARGAPAEKVESGMYSYLDKLKFGPMFRELKKQYGYEDIYLVDEDGSGDMAWHRGARL